VSFTEIDNQHEQLEANHIHIPDSELMAVEVRQKVQRVINALPEGTRLVFTLSRFENMSNRDIALQLNVSVKAVEKHMTIALKHIRKYLPFLLWLKFFLG
jgi:RNA polymerase sigma-70 factor (ECF subfamily)